MLRFPCRGRRLYKKLDIWSCAVCLHKWSSFNYRDIGVASGGRGQGEAAPRALTLAPTKFLVFAIALPVVMLVSKLPNKYLFW